MALVETSIRGPGTFPDAIALRSPMSRKSDAPTSRTVVNPAISVTRAFTLASSACSATVLVSVSICCLRKSSSYAIVKCVCASMKPGRIVASPKSMTSDPAGISAFAPTPRIVSPNTTTSPGDTTRSPTPSNILAPLITMGRDCADASAAATINKMIRISGYSNEDDPKSTRSAGGNPGAVHLDRHAFRQPAGHRGRRSAGRQPRLLFVALHSADAFQLRGRTQDMALRRDLRHRETWPGFPADADGAPGSRRRPAVLPSARLDDRTPRSLDRRSAAGHRFHVRDPRSHRFWTERTALRTEARRDAASRRLRSNRIGAHARRRVFSRRPRPLGQGDLRVGRVRHLARHGPRFSANRLAPPYDS